MNRLFFTLAIIGTVLVGGWLVVSVYAKSRYDRIRQQEFGRAYVVAPTDENDEVFLSDVQSNWLCKVDVTNGPFATSTLHSQLLCTSERKTSSFSSVGATTDR